MAQQRKADAKAAAAAAAADDDDDASFAAAEAEAAAEPELVRLRGDLRRETPRWRRSPRSSKRRRPADSHRVRPWKGLAEDASVGHRKRTRSSAAASAAALLRRRRRRRVWRSSRRSWQRRAELEAAGARLAKEGRRQLADAEEALCR